MLFDDVRRQADEGRHSRGDAALLGQGKAAPADQGGDIIGSGELHSLVEHLAHRSPLPVNPAVIPGTRGHRRQGRHKGHLPAGIFRREGDQQHAVERQVLGHPDDGGGPTGAVALAGQVPRRGLSVIGPEPIDDDRLHRPGVAGDAVEPLRVRPRQRPREAGSHGVDEHQVDRVQRTGSVIAIAAAVAVSGWHGRADHRTEGAHVQRRGRGTRAAVEGEHHRPARRVGDVVADVGDRGGQRRRSARGVPEKHIGNCRGVAQLLAVEGSLVASHRDPRRRRRRLCMSSRQRGHGERKGQDGASGPDGHSGHLQGQSLAAVGWIILSFCQAGRSPDGVPTRRAKR